MLPASLRTQKWCVAFGVVFFAAVLSLGAVLCFGTRPARLMAADYAPPPAEMVFVPPGDFLMGSDAPEASPDEHPLRTAFVPGFYIDRFEVTNADYQKFDPAHTFAEGRADFPVTGLTLVKARAYAAFLGKRLPTATEWEKAARGTDGRTFTWGDEFAPGIANLGGRAGLEAVGSFPGSASPYGAQDMIGNAWEWVDNQHVDRGIFGQQLYATEIIKGGGFSYSPFQGRASYNGFEGNGGTCHDVGFRCAKDAAPVNVSESGAPIRPANG